MVFSNRKKAQQARRAAEAEQLRVDNEIILFIENQIADSEDEKECDDHLKEQLFPVFLKSDTAKPALGKRKNKFGNLKRYKMPIRNPNPLKKKLMSKPVPKQTLQYRQKKAVAAVGKNIGLMNNWVIRDSKAEEALSSDPIIDTPPEILDSDHHEEDTLDNQGYGSDNSEDSSDIEDDSSNHTEDCGRDTVEPCGLDPEYDEWILSSLQKAQVARKAKIDSKDALASQRLAQIENQWATLDLKIKAATKRYEADHAKNPKHDVPYLVLAELTEFNYRHKELSLANSKSPAIQASILTAQASLRRLPRNYCYDLVSRVLV
ncbi:hypothetical protein DFH28DRAFT_1163076 [Melampsora americana]|nr:hypothetical protein DFH28DRAFT_1163076 [Melampsora americana]